MTKPQKDTINILAEMRRKLEERKARNRSATFFVSFLYLVGFMLLVYMSAFDILAYISIFVVMIFVLVYANFRQSKEDIIRIDDLYMEFEYLKNNKK